MKTHRFEIARFLPTEADNTGDIFIDWPRIHRQAGLDHIQWLRSQHRSECQLLIERRPGDSYNYVVAEIYSDKLATVYSLMWAK
jgi:hypothetical protein